MSERIAFLLHAVGILLGYGRPLPGTVQQRAAAPNFAHLNRGILRATALERVLLARAASGRDISFVTSRTRAAGPPPSRAPAAALATGPP
jgi:hypothetical protein